MPLKSGETVIDAHGRDLARHGSALLPIACYEDDVNRLDIPWHWHVELEAVVVTRGRAILTAGAERYLVGEGEGVFYQLRRAAYHPPSGGAGVPGPLDGVSPTAGGREPGQRFLGGLRPAFDERRRAEGGPF